MVLHAHEQVCKRFPDALLVLVPRHPERFAAVRSLLHKKGLNFVARTDGVPCTSDTEVYLGDTMGDVPLFYAAANVAFVGGSLVPVGGHNLLEPAALGRPVVTGPHLFHTQDIADKFEKFGASIAVNTASQLGSIHGKCRFRGWQSRTRRWAQSTRACGARPAGSDRTAPVSYTGYRRQV